MLNRIFLFFLLAILIAACNSDETSGDKQKTKEKQMNAPVAVPKFERDSAYSYVAKQVAFGPRNPNSAGHDACREWLVKTFKRFGAKVIEQKFQDEAYTGEQLNGTNIIAQYNPESTNRILLAAHWDTRPMADSPLSVSRHNEPILGADDGGSGVAVLLEVARNLQNIPIDLGVDIILFDMEDYGDSREGGTEEEKKAAEDSFCLGSQYWSENQHASGFKYGILLDMVGAKNARFPKEGWSMRFARPLVEKVWELAERMGYGNYFANVQLEGGGGLIDDHYYVNTMAKIPMIDIINLPPNPRNKSFGDHWHTHNDNMEVINKRTLGAVGQVLLAVIIRQANGNFL